ncbi:MAG: hypothetical protein ACRC1H_17400, partial [Caldilineaceae bacterium]
FRYTAMLPTVITTSQELDKVDPWLRARFLDNMRCRYCAITAGPYRGYNGGSSPGGYGGRGGDTHPSSPRPPAGRSGARGGRQTP